MSALPQLGHLNVVVPWIFVTRFLQDVQTVSSILKSSNMSQREIASL
jgi:hypothetical protein